MFIREVVVHEFRNLTDVRLGPFATPTTKSDIIVLAGANGGGKSSILELVSFGYSSSFGFSYNSRRPMPKTFRFEVSIGLSNEELQLIDSFVQENRQDAQMHEALNQLLQERFYVRTFVKNTSDPSKPRLVYNYCHTLVTNVLRQHLKRPLGFFLKPDRFYPTDGFQQNQLFNYQQMTTREHVWSMAYSAAEHQYRDMFDHLVQLRYHYVQSLGEYHYSLERHEAPIREKPTDPITPYEELLGRLLPGYSFSRSNEQTPTNLFVQLPNKEIIGLLGFKWVTGLGSGRRSGSRSRSRSFRSCESRGPCI
jgi:hypothetical protein